MGMTDLSGQYLGRYHLIERLGEGGMAVVYKAYDTRLERDVAVKIIRSGAFPIDLLHDVLKRFEREAKSLARLSHPNIVKVHDYGEHEGSPYLVMEYLPGGTLKKILGKPIAWQDAARLLLPIARGLVYAHQHGILHRDIKPANILITDSGEPMLSDFGIAKILEGEQSTVLTGSGMAIGTPEYMAPEQWTGSTSLQSDLYSFAIMFYEMIAGRKPYVADTPAAILIKQATEPLPRPSQFVANVPEAVEKLLIKALAKDPENRYPSMGDFVSALEDLLKNSLPTHAQSVPVEVTEVVTAVHEDPLPSKVVKTEIPPAPLKAATMPSTKRPHRQLSWRWGVAFMSSVAIIIAIYFSIPQMNQWFAPKPVSTPIATITKTETPKVVDTATLSATVLTEAPLSTTTPVPAKTSTLILDIGSTFLREKDGMSMIYIPPGDFYMGSSCGEPGCVFKQGGHIDSTEAYWIDRTEITNAMYSTCVLAKGCTPISKISLGALNNYYGDTGYDNYPVVNVTFQQAETYCTWSGGRLPTNKEWEKAARGTDGRGFPWGLDHQGFEANFCDANCVVTNVMDRTANDGYKYAAPVDSFSSFASPYGVLNMAGNVSELVKEQSVRGGAWNSPERGLWTFMSGIGGTPPSDSIGFRCALSADSSILLTGIPQAVPAAQATSANFTPSPIVSIPTLAYVEDISYFHQDFENTDVISDWAFASDPSSSNPRKYWTIVSDTDGNHVLAGNAPSGTEIWITTGSNQWKNYSFEVRARIMSNSAKKDNSSLGVDVRNSNDAYGSYGYELTFGKLWFLSRHTCSLGADCSLSWLVEQKPTKITVGTWFTIRIDLFGPEIRVYVNGELLREITDKTSLMGTVSLDVPPGTEVYFDDVRLTKLVTR
jgi:serine/threonine protein kinase